jgi:hypothetical protein
MIAQTAAILLIIWPGHTVAPALYATVSACEQRLGVLRDSK